MKPGSAYEGLVRDIYQALLVFDGINEVVVQRNAKVTGISGQPHEVDVYWELVLAGIRYRTCVECKDWKSPVTKEKIMALLGVIQDLGSGTAGIIVSRSGFQQGVKTVAECYKIGLVQVTPVASQIHIETIFHTQPGIIDAKIDVDLEQAKSRLPEGMTGFQYSSSIRSDEPAFCDEDGTGMRSMSSLVDAETLGEGWHRLPIPDLYVPSEIGTLRIEALRVLIEAPPPFKSNTTIDTGETARAVVHDVLEGHDLVLMKDGSVQKRDL